MASQVSGSPSKERGLSAARARVKALYDARKARLAARRSASTAGQTAVQKPAKRRRDYEDKENTPVIPMTTPHRYSGRRSSLVPLSKGHTNYTCHTRTSKTNLLTPIKEETNPRLLGLRQAAFNVQPTLSDLEGDYVTLKSPLTNYVNVQKATPLAPHQSFQGSCLNDTSIWVNSTDGLTGCKNATAELSAHDYTGSPRRVLSPGQRESPVKYASSNTISELYTSKHIKDLSHISNVCEASIREQVSSSNIHGAVFHSTFNYPLHSTLNEPFNSTISFLDDVTPKSNTPSPSDFPGFTSDTRTTISEPSAARHKKNILSLPRSQDDIYTDSTQKSRSSRREKSRRRSEQITTPKSRVSQVTTKLCKEHGLHPTFGGPCIFSNDDSFTLSDDSPEEDLKRMSYMTETDCDSSYLSECMDDGSNFNMGLSEAEEYTATYDARNGRMKMLKRQTAQTQLKDAEVRYPIGLSDSDFLDTTHNYTRNFANLNNTHMDATQKHFSLVATRSSLPDLSALSCGSQEDLDTTVQENRPPSSSRSSHKESDGLSPNDTDKTLVTVREQQLTVSTPSAETSPDTSLPVPVNSPNVTDSTGSSSKQNTDTYDYVEMPVPKFVKVDSSRLPPRPLGSRSARKRSSHRHIGSSKSLASHRSARDAQSQVSKAKSDSPSAHRQARRSLRYHHDCDSGFSTPASQPKHGGHIVISDDAGNTRTIVQHSAVARNLQRERKKALVKKIKKFTNNFHTSTGNLHIRTLGHF